MAGELVLSIVAGRKFRPAVALVTGNATCPGRDDRPSPRTRMHDRGNHDTARKTFVAPQPIGRLAKADAPVICLRTDLSCPATGIAPMISGGWTNT